MGKDIWTLEPHEITEVVKVRIFFCFVQGRSVDDDDDDMMMMMVLTCPPIL